MANEHWHWKKKTSPSSLIKPIFLLRHWVKHKRIWPSTHNQDSIFQPSDSGIETRKLFSMLKVIVASLKRSMPSCPKKVRWCRWQPKKMLPSLVQVSQRPQQSNSHVQLSRPHAVHQSSSILHKMKHEQLVDPLIPREDKMPQTLFLHP